LRGPGLNGSRLGPCARPRKRLVINADDLGYDPEIDRGIFEAHARGVVTSATGMVDTPFAPAALRAATRLARAGAARRDRSVAPARAGGKGAAAPDRALRRAAWRAATHLDSHKHHHARPELLAAFAAVAGAQGLPVRAPRHAMRDLLRAHGVRTTEHFLGDADLRPCWTPERLAPALETLEDRHHRADVPSRVRAVARPDLLRRGARGGAPLPVRRPGATGAGARGGRAGLLQGPVDSGTGRPGEQAHV